MKKNLTELILIVDRSSSMNGIKVSTISGLKEFLNTQKEIPGEALLTYVTFSSDYKVEINSKNVKDINSLIFNEYTPSGMTALLDAIGRTIDSVGNRLASQTEDERPEKVMVIILTDGEENSSKEYTNKLIKEKIKHQEEKYKWEFLFLGADIDAITAGNSMNMSKSVNLNKFDMKRNMSKTAVYSASYRGADLSDKDNKFSTLSTGYFSMSDDQLENELENIKVGK